MRENAPKKYAALSENLELEKKADKLTLPKMVFDTSFRFIKDFLGIRK